MVEIHHYAPGLRAKRCWTDVEDFCHRKPVVRVVTEQFARHYCDRCFTQWKTRVRDMAKSLGDGTAGPTPDDARGWFEERLRRETIRVEAEDKEKGAAMMAPPTDEQVVEIRFRYHELKCWPEAFEALRTAQKKADFRRDDRGFEEGDLLILQEWVPVLHGSEIGDYTGAILALRISHVERGFGIPDGFAMLSVERFEDRVMVTPR